MADRATFLPGKCLKILLYTFAILLIGTLSAEAQVSMPSVNLSMGEADSPEEVSKGIQILIWLTVLTLAPSIFILSTSFLRIVIVLSIIRRAIGVGQLPPAQIIVGLALLLSFFVMAPTVNKINDNAFKPYMNNEITQEMALKRGLEPLRDFMLRQTSESDLALFVKMAKIDKPQTIDDVPTYVLMPAFVISELKTAFKIGFMVFVPFLVIDITIASILVSMGMLFLPPMMISMPFKLITKAGINT
jgi:flagellar biosynthetic protein FliP